MDKAMFFRAFMVGIVVRCACPRWGLVIIHSCKKNHGISLPFPPVGEGQIFISFDTLSGATQPSQGDNHDAF
jgi:hypothetical protein